MPSASPDLSVVIVTHNAGKDIGACLRSLRQHTHGIAYEVILVDNASADRTVDIALSSGLDLRLIRNTENSGFPAANNSGLRSARGRHIVLLNSDTLLQDDALSRLVEHLDQHPGVAAVGPRMIDGRGRPLATAHAFGSLKTLFFATTGVDRLVPRRLRPLAARLVGREARLHVGAMNASHPVTTDWLSGACLVVRRPVVEQVGLLDERYFIFMEDEDWCRRMKAAGWEVHLVPTAQIVHLVGGGMPRSPRVVRAQIESPLAYHSRYSGSVTVALVRLLLLVEIVKQAVVVAARAAIRRDLRAFFEPGLRTRLTLAGKLLTGGVEYWIGTRGFPSRF